jgi:transcriptional regulator with XRE-family HTH domain
MARKSWSEIKSKTPPEARARAAQKTRDMSAAIHLDALRRMVGITQGELAERLGTNQPSVSKLERRQDMYVSSLRHVVAALGGTLEISARFPGFTIPLLASTVGAGSSFSVSPRAPERTIGLDQPSPVKHVSVYWAGFGTIVGGLPPQTRRFTWEDAAELSEASAFDGNETEQAA